MCNECGCWEDEVEEEIPVSPCPMCSGPGILLGTLARRAHFRCIGCGIMFSRTIEIDEQLYDD